MKLAFIGNWNNFPFSIGFGLCRFCSNQDVKIINTRIKKRNTAHFSEINFKQTQSKLMAYESKLDISSQDIINDNFKINSLILEAISWCDVLFVCGENFYLSNIVKNKPVIGIPVGFEFEMFGANENKNLSTSYFREGLINCSAYLKRTDFTSYTNQFFLENSLHLKNIDYPSFPVPFELSKLILDQNKSTYNENTKSIFYATRITSNRKLYNNNLTSTDEKGHELFFQAAIELKKLIVENDIYISAIGRDAYSCKYLQSVKGILGDRLIILNELSYIEFLMQIKNSLLVVETLGKGKDPHGTASDALALSKPILSAFNLTNNQNFMLNKLGLNNEIYDTATLANVAETKELLTSIIHQVSLKNNDKKAFIFNEPLSEWDRIITDYEFSVNLNKYINLLA